MKKIIGLLLTLSVSIGILLFSADSVIAASYNSSAALNYAAAHWNDNVGLCAEFVSNCLSAGGCSAWSRSSSALRNQLINSGLGTEYELTLNSDKSITASNYSGKLAAGDVIFYYCPGAKCSARPYVHTVLCNGADANGYVKVYAHNKANNGSKKYYYSKTCPNCGTGIYKAYVYHFKTNETPANIGTNVYGTIINTACWKPITYNPADGLVRLNQANGMANQAWKFFRQSDGSYVIKSAVDQKVLEIFNGDTADGTPIVVRNTDWGGAYQRWYLYPYGNNGGYIIKSKHYPEKNLVLDLCGGSTVDNNIIQIHERNNTNAQIFSVYTASDSVIASPNLTVSAGTAVTNTVFNWNNVPGKDRYDLKIWKVKIEGDSYHTEWGTYSGYGKVLPAGNYVAYVDAVNAFDCLRSNVVQFTVKNPIFKVSFNSNGGSCSTSSKNVTYTATYGDLPVPTRTGYTFKGWYTSASGTTKITGENKVNITSNQTLYAQWTPSSYTVSFNSNGGVCSINKKTVSYNASYGDLPVPTRTGYTFKGWYTSASGTTKITGESKVNITSNQTLYAQWIPNTYTVVYNPNGGIGTTANSSHTFDTAKSLNINNFTKEGYSFKGWSKNKDAEIPEFTDQQSVKNLTSQNNAVVNMYAVWSPNNSSAYTKTTLKDGIFNVKAFNLNENCIIILALYKDGLLVETQQMEYDKTDVIFYADKEFDSAKVMVWKDSQSQKPLTDTEDVVIP